MAPGHYIRSMDDINLEIKRLAIKTIAEYQYGNDLNSFGQQREGFVEGYLRADKSLLDFLELFSDENIENELSKSRNLRNKDQVLVGARWMKEQMKNYINGLSWKK